MYCLDIMCFWENVELVRQLDTKNRGSMHWIIKVKKKNLSPSKNNQQSVDSKKAKTNAKDDDDEDKDNTVNGFNRRCTEVEDHPI
ncbi:hypothetical protein RCL_jg22191.t1 [Rhizophagus clarus]|uniref:Uncharacterized protein n=1 Tax=Rhizophagus clarus TaxID=94130 RepID=A0A8H3QSC8_9GLOM|nr:hypothetical protein RCL_jg22191.t1 [Rhizophagus clarus]